MRAARYDFSTHMQAAHWPFAVREVRVTPLIAPEFQAAFHKILTTTRFYFDVPRTPERESRKRSPRR